ncbi:MAG: hypothetical protein KGN32_08010 [Burkholderiales bacterium]|nr:hypothetical protein [Burkholderiales bacterium]
MSHCDWLICGAMPGMARFGKVGAGRLGVSIAAQRKLGTPGRVRPALCAGAVGLRIRDAHIPASMLVHPTLHTARQMDSWAKAFEY